MESEDVQSLRTMISGRLFLGCAEVEENLWFDLNTVLYVVAAERVESAVESLREEFGDQRVWGTKRDVREEQDINNAGSNAYSYKPLAEASDEDLIFAAYGATKRSVVHLTKSLQAELQMHDVKNVVVHNLSPGMVTTDLLKSGANTKQAKFFINVLAEPPEVVAQYLVPKVDCGSGSTKPTYIRFLTGMKAYSQIFSVCG
ncbi:LOW QUALITY PROTEIN: hypothetical protein Cgig2_005156 [Carnegiea gigantea]|uniref:Uncharacterized protein n=1 Tax=Carnegiea gigantea TaxID=171969 RepID=A0A9Q1QI08_9CARY|nr:LOW QUALITY PROTEIN: hypothetical protein Cgig2_005156 [Carnegiea gigantea]